MGHEGRIERVLDFGERRVADELFRDRPIPDAVIERGQLERADLVAIKARARRSAGGAAAAAGSAPATRGRRSRRGESGGSASASFWRPQGDGKKAMVRYSQCIMAKNTRVPRQCSSVDGSCLRLSLPLPPQAEQPRKAMPAFARSRRPARRHFSVRLYPLSGRPERRLHGPLQIAVQRLHGDGRIRRARLPGQDAAGGDKPNKRIADCADRM